MIFGGHSSVRWPFKCSVAIQVSAQVHYLAAPVMAEKMMKRPAAVVKPEPNAQDKDTAVQAAEAQMEFFENNKKERGAAYGRLKTAIYADGRPDVVQMYEDATKAKGKMVG